MTAKEIAEFLRQAAIQAIRDRLAADLNVQSRRMGSRGPGELGPEEPYIQALERCSPETLAKVGLAANAILLEEARGDANMKPVPDPLLLYNILSLLEAFPLPEARPGLDALRVMREPLQKALTDYGEDLYTQALLALAAVQTDALLADFWIALLQDADLHYVEAAVIGLRKCGWMAACGALGEIKEVFDRRPELGPFSRVVMLLVDEHPEANWPDCGRDYCGGWEHEEIRSLIERYSRNRFSKPLYELPSAAGSALAELKKKGITCVEKIEREHAARPVSPSRVLMAAP